VGDAGKDDGMTGAQVVAQARAVRLKLKVLFTRVMPEMPSFTMDALIKASISSRSRLASTI